MPRATFPVVLIASTGQVSILAGATRMRILPFVVLDAAGTITRLVVIKALARVFTGPLAAANRFVDRYQWWLVGLSVAIAAWQISRRRRATQRQPAETQS